MADLQEQVRRYRTNADEAFATAHTMRNEVARDALLDMAEGYDQLADRLEDLDTKRRARLRKDSASPSDGAG
jgi:hypothetical protein